MFFVFYAIQQLLANCGPAKSLQSCLTLCDPVDCSLPDSSVHGILQSRTLEWVPCPPPGDLPNPGIKPASLISPALAGEFFTTSATWEAPSLPVSLSYNSNSLQRNSFFVVSFFFFFLQRNSMSSFLFVCLLTVSLN